MMMVLSNIIDLCVFYGVLNVIIGDIDWKFFVISFYMVVELSDGSVVV